MAKPRNQQVADALKRKRVANPKVPLVRQQPAIPVAAPITPVSTPVSTPRTVAQPSIRNNASPALTKILDRNAPVVPTDQADVQLVEQAPDVQSTFAADPVPLAVPRRSIPQIASGDPRASARVSAQAGQAERTPIPVPSLAVQAPAPVVAPAPAPAAPAITPPVPTRPELAGTPSAPALAEADNSFRNLFQKNQAETLQRLKTEAAGKASIAEAEYGSVLKQMQDQATKEKENLKIKADKELQTRIDRLVANGQLPTDSQGNLTLSAIQRQDAVKAEISERLAANGRTIDSKFLSDKLSLDVKKQDDMRKAREDINAFELESLGKQRDFLLESAQSELGNEQAIALQQLKGAQDLQSMAFQGQIDLTTQEQKTLQEGAQAMQLQAQGSILDTTQKLAVQEANAITDERLQTIKGQQARQSKLDDLASFKDKELFKAQVKDQFTKTGIQTEDVMSRLKDISNISNTEEAKNAMRFLQTELDQAGINYSLNDVLETIGTPEDFRTLEADFLRAKTGKEGRAGRGTTAKTTSPIDNLGRFDQIHELTVLGAGIMDSEEIESRINSGESASSIEAAIKRKLAGSGQPTDSLGDPVESGGSEQGFFSIVNDPATYMGGGFEDFINKVGPAAEKAVDIISTSPVGFAKLAFNRFRSRNEAVGRADSAKGSAVDDILK